MILNRRKFLKTIARTGAAAALAGTTKSAWPEAPAGAAGSFDFIFFTDTHIEPELDATRGCEMCFRKIAGMKADFAIMGGDHVYDVLGVDRQRADLVFDLYEKTQQTIGMPLYQTIGNHDAFGVLTKSGITPSDPYYGKKMYEDRVSRRTYDSFDHKGWHFVVLDSIQPTEDRLWEARVDDAQLRWLENDLDRVVPGTPIIVAVHVPLVTAFATWAPDVDTDRKYNTLNVANGPQVVTLLDGHNVVAVLQGHTHVNEFIELRKTKYITGGAVCGNWWHGPRLGFSEGFTVVSLRGGQISTHYETYGFKSVDPREKF
jgi:3',5'-cyclic-AMP phosphodiesterase